jgi:hypothetical protein
MDTMTSGSLQFGEAVHAWLDRFLGFMRGEVLIDEAEVEGVLFMEAAASFDDSKGDPT